MPSSLFVWSEMRLSGTPNCAIQWRMRALAHVCRGILHWYGLWPAREAVDDCEEVGLVLRGWKGANDVDVDAAEASVWQGPLGERGVDVALDFLGLAVVTFLAPAADILLKAVPDKAGSNSSLRWLASRVGESVDGLEDVPGPL